MTKRYRGQLQTVIEDLDLPNPVIRTHYGHGFAKQYVRDHVALRTEPATNNVNDYGVKKAVEHLPELRDKMGAVIDNYLNVQQDILETFVDRGQLRTLAAPTVLPSGRRIPGLKLDHPRQLALMHALVCFAHIPAQQTFTTAELYPKTLAALGVSVTDYTLAALRYVCALVLICEGRPGPGRGVRGATPGNATPGSALVHVRGYRLGGMGGPRYGTPRPARWPPAVRIVVAVRRGPAVVPRAEAVTASYLPVILWSFGLPSR